MPPAARFDGSVMDTANAPVTRDFRRVGNGRRPRGVPRWALLGLLGVATLLVLPPPLAHAGPPTSAAGSLAAAGTNVTLVNATLRGGPTIAHTASTFFGLVAPTAQPNGIATNRGVGVFLNSTPFVSFSYTEDSDQCNITTNTLWSSNGVPSGGCPLDVAAFKAWCTSRGASCVSIIDLPGENNNTGEDVNMANYIVHTVGFQPTYWALGDEPELWTHYGIPWSQWRSTDATNATMVAYSVELRTVIAAVRAVDPAGKWIGVQSDCGQCSLNYIKTVARIDGTRIAAMAFHTYPSERLTNVSLAQFFRPLYGHTNISTSYTRIRADIANQCPNCSTMPIFITEYNSGPGWGPTNFAGSYPNAAFLAASEIQALRANVSMLTIYALQGTGPGFDWVMMNGTDALGPQGVLYGSLLEKMAIGTVEGVTIRSTAKNLWGVITYHGPEKTFLFVNANVTHSVDLTLGGALKMLNGTLATVSTWQSGQASPVTITVSALSRGYVVPVGGILMIDYRT
jgi:hypothetical protein